MRVDREKIKRVPFADYGVKDSFLFNAVDNVGKILGSIAQTAVARMSGRGKADEAIQWDFWEKIYPQLSNRELRALEAAHNLVLNPGSVPSVFMEGERLPLFYSFIYHLHNPDTERGAVRRRAIAQLFEEWEMGKILPERLVLGRIAEMRQWLSVNRGIGDAPPR